MSLSIGDNGSFGFDNDSIIIPSAYGPTSANVPPNMLIPQRHDNYGNRVSGIVRMANDNDDGIMFPCLEVQV